MAVTRGGCVARIGLRTRTTGLWAAAIAAWLTAIACTATTTAATAAVGYRFGAD